MVKKRNRRTRKKYKKRGGFTDKQLKDCNDRLKKQGVKSMVKRRNMCNESNAMAGLDTQEPAPIEPVQPIAQPKQPTELKQSSGVQTVIAPLEEEPKKPSIKDRASALENQFGKTGMRKTRKALRTTTAACRAAVDENGNKYYYNEANETTYDPTDEVCHPKDGIEKTGNKSGNCIGARYKGGEEYWYHPTEQFSTHDKNHPKCHAKSEPIEVKLTTHKIFPHIESIVIPEQLEDKKKKAKDELPSCDTFNGRTCDLNRCVLEPKKAAQKRTKKRAKELKKKDRLCLDKKKGGRKTKRKNKMKKRKKSRKRRK